MSSRLLLLTLASALQISAGSITGLFYTSASESWVGQGQTVTALPSDGFTFDVHSGTTRSFLADSVTDYVTFTIRNYSADLPWYDEPWWEISFAMPVGHPLAVGTYNNVQRFPFQAIESAGLSFAGNNRGDDQIAGNFSILAVGFDNSGRVDSFAADFLQDDETHPGWWNLGKIRYNSDIPLTATPEPSSILLMLVAVCALGLLCIARPFFFPQRLPKPAR